MCAYPNAICLFRFTGGSSVPKTYTRRPRGRYLVDDREGNLVDEFELRRRKKESERMAEHSKRGRKGVSKRKGKQPRPNYKAMDPTTFSSIRHRDLFDESPRDPEVGDSRFWCSHQR